MHHGDPFISSPAFRHTVEKEKWGQPVFGDPGDTRGMADLHPINPLTSHRRVKTDCYTSSTTLCMMPSSGTDEDRQQSSDRNICVPSMRSLSFYIHSLNLTFSLWFTIFPLLISLCCAVQPPFGDIQSPSLWALFLSANCKLNPAEP
jgi:hypothetical protein